MDGTLYSHTTKEIPDSTKQSLRLLRKNGIKTFVCTGRHITELDRFLPADVCFDGFITLNGQLCLDTDRRLLSGTPFDSAAADRIVQLFQSGRYPLILEDEEKIYINFVNDRVKSVQAEVSTPVPPVRVYDGLQIYQIIAYFTREEEPLILPSLTDNCMITRWSEGGINIIPSGGGKAAGILKLLNTIGISPAETIAFGDAENDIDMLRLAGTSVAMGNGVPAAKAAADYVTDDIDLDGIQKTLLHYHLI